MPAVKKVNEVEVSKFIQKLVQEKCKWIGKQQSQLGLSTGLGGCGVSLMELTNLYRCFAKKGMYTDLKFIKDQAPDTQHLQLISEAAAYMLTTILCKLTRLDLPNNYENMRHVMIAWTTGTSFGRRHAWRIASI